MGRSCVVVAGRFVHATKDLGIVANAVSIFVRRARSATHAKGVKLVAVAVAVAFGNVRAAALVDVAWAVAHAASIKGSYAVVNVVADAVSVFVRSAVTATHAKGVKLVAVAVAVALWNVSTAALVDLSWTVANAASIKGSYAVVNVVADAIGVFVRCAVTTTHAKRVKLVAVAIAVA